MSKQLVDALDTATVDDALLTEAQAAVEIIPALIHTHVLVVHQLCENFLRP